MTAPVIHLPDDTARQIEQCYREHTPGQQMWLRWARWMRSHRRGHEVPVRTLRDAA